MNKPIQVYISTDDKTFLKESDCVEHEERLFGKSRKEMKEKSKS